MRGIRGAVTVAVDEREPILCATKRLLFEMMERNAIEVNDIVSAFFSMTTDLRAIFPTQAARELGWTQVPMLNVTEIDVPGSLSKCVRVLLHVNTDVDADQIRHVYLDGAEVLRPDWVSSQSDVATP